MGALSLTAAIRQRMLNYLQRLYLDLWFDAPPADSFSSYRTPVETLTSPDDGKTNRYHLLLCDIIRLKKRGVNVYFVKCF